MKKILTISLIGALILSGFGTVVSSNFTERKALQHSINNKSMVIFVSFPSIDEYCIIDSKKGQKIEIDGFNYLLDSGKPMLPSKNIIIALPPGSRVQSLDFEGVGVEQLQGNYWIMPAPNIVSLDGSDLKQNCIEMFKEKWQENYEAIYFSDEAFPSKPGKFVGSGSLRKYSYVSVSVYPFRYHPESERLFRYNSVQITVNYDLPSSDSLEAQDMGEMRWDILVDKEASELFVNYDDIKELYEPQGSRPMSREETYNYVIISTSDLSDAITSSGFLSWKNMIGYDVQIVHVTSSEITSQPGQDLAEQIRNFLREYYIGWGIEYVLLVGDYETVPVRYCYPDPTNHLNTAGTPGGNGGEVPTDYYYADLSSSDKDSWDFDGDGYYGEYGQDQPDFLSEVYVGRIPINDPSRIQYTLEKTMAFEQDTGDWKSNALHAGAFFYFTNELGAGTSAMDGAVCCAYIENDIMNGWTISHYSEQEGLEKSVYPWNALSEAAFTNDWRTGKYSIVNWGAHGWSNSIARKVWSWDDGDGIPESHEMSWPTLLSTSSNLDDDYPSIVTAISCYVGYPEPNTWGNMGIDLLTKPSYGASIGVIASARSPYGSLNWPSNPGGSDSIIYEFNNNLINKSEKVGEALYNSKYFCNLQYGWSSYFEYIDMYTFNLFGDPSLTREGINITGRPDKPSTPSGPVSGKIGEKYTYSSTSFDPDDDQIYYLFSWGDGTDSSWLGPINSGEIFEASHIWESKGSYEIKTRAKDINGLVSDWSEPLPVSMPKNKAFNFNFNLLEWLIERFPNAFPILRHMLGL